MRLTHFILWVWGSQWVWGSLRNTQWSHIHVWVNLMGLTHSYAMRVRLSYAMGVGLTHITLRVLLDLPPWGSQLCYGCIAHSDLHYKCEAHFWVTTVWGSLNTLKIPQWGSLKVTLEVWGSHWRMWLEWPLRGSFTNTLQLWGSLTLELLLWGSQLPTDMMLTHIYNTSMRLTHSCEAHLQLYIGCKAHSYSYLSYHHEAHSQLCYACKTHIYITSVSTQSYAMS